MVPNLPDAVTFNTVPPVLAAPNHKIIPLLLRNCDFATVMNQNENNCFVMLFGDPRGKDIRPSKGSQLTG